MPTTVSQLTDLEDFVACEDLQAGLVGAGARSILPVPALAAIDRSGGLLLGAWATEGERRTLRGALIDLVAEADGYPARFSVLLAVDRAFANRGVAQALRAAERAACVRAKVDLVYWWSDPLSGTAAHIAFNRLGAIATGHTRNALGPLGDEFNRGLATDRVRVEWWIEAPRVVAVLDNDRNPPHYGLGLDRMQLLTRSTTRPSGQRGPIGVDGTPTKPFALVEVPADLDAVRARDPSAARDWRLTCREAFELLFSNGYLIVGFVHEGGRSFHLFERRDRGTILGRSRAA